MIAKSAMRVSQQCAFFFIQEYLFECKEVVSIRLRTSCEQKAQNSGPVIRYKNTYRYFIQTNDKT